MDFEIATNAKGPKVTDCGSVSVKEARLLVNLVNRAPTTSKYPKKMQATSSAMTLESVERQTLDTTYIAKFEVKPITDSDGMTDAESMARIMRLGIRDNQGTWDDPLDQESYTATFDLLPEGDGPIDESKVETLGTIELNEDEVSNLANFFHHHEYMANQEGGCLEANT